MQKGGTKASIPERERATAQGDYSRLCDRGHSSVGGVEGGQRKGSCCCFK